MQAEPRSFLAVTWNFFHYRLQVWSMTTRITTGLNQISNDISMSGRVMKTIHDLRQRSWYRAPISHSRILSPRMKKIIKGACEPFSHIHLVCQSNFCQVSGVKNATQYMRKYLSSDFDGYIVFKEEDNCNFSKSPCLCL